MLKDSIVMITGATSGIGLATTKEFLDQGATVIGIGRNFGQKKRRKKIQQTTLNVM